MQKKSPYAAVALSLVPGLGQLYVGRPKKGLALLFITAVMAAALYFYPSRVARLLTIGLYVVLMVPAAVEAFWAAKLGPDANLAPKAYVVLMLLTAGFSALPLLWQDPRFSKRSKIAWSVAVPLLAIAFFAALARYGPWLENFLRRYG